MQKFHTQCQFISWNQCDQIWQKFTSLWQIFDSFFLFGKMISLFWQTCDIIVLIFHLANDQILKNNPTIWSHWN